MTVTLKTPITVPEEVRRRAGLKPGDEVEFVASGRAIVITPKLSPDEVDDERELRDPKVRAAIRKSYHEFIEGKSRPIGELFSKRDASRGEKRKRRTR